MESLVLAHAGDLAMWFFPIAAAVCLFIAMKDTPKARNSGTPALPTNPLSRQVHAALTPPKAHEPRSPAAAVPTVFRPSRRPTKRLRGETPLQSAPPPGRPGSVTWKR